jgi:hypothetical protein
VFRLHRAETAPRLLLDWRELPALLLLVDPHVGVRILLLFEEGTGLDRRRFRTETSDWRTHLGLSTEGTSHMVVLCGDFT